MSHENAPHEHAVEHAAHSGDQLSRWVAVFTAILAALSGLLHYQEGVLQTQALISKNDAVLLQSKASDQWNYYQAQSNKGHPLAGQSQGKKNPPRNLMRPFIPWTTVT
jgi:hypothetical protein